MGENKSQGSKDGGGGGKGEFLTWAIIKDPPSGGGAGVRIRRIGMTGGDSGEGKGAVRGQRLSSGKGALVGPFSVVWGTICHSKPGLLFFLVVLSWIAGWPLSVKGKQKSARLDRSLRQEF